MDVKQQFFNEVWDLCLSTSKICGVFPEIIFGQTAIETGYGLHTPGNNYFGIKAGPSTGQAGGIVRETFEYIKGILTRVPAAFASYTTPAASFAGYGYFILHNRRYTALRSARTISLQLMALGESGYSTNPAYAIVVGHVVDLVPSLIIGQREQKVPSPVGNNTGLPIATEVSQTHKAQSVVTSTAPSTKEIQPMSDVTKFLTQHKSLIGTFASVLDGLIPLLPVPAIAATGLADLVNLGNSVANEPIPVIITPTAVQTPGNITITETGPAGGVVVTQPVGVVGNTTAILPVEVNFAISEGLKVAGELSASYKSGNLTLHTAEVIGVETAEDVITEAENLFNPGLGITKDPNSN